MSNYFNGNGRGHRPSREQLRRTDSNLSTPTTRLVNLLEENGGRMSWKITLEPTPPYIPKPVVAKEVTPRPAPEPRRVVWLSGKKPDSGEMELLQRSFTRGATPELHPIGRPVVRTLIDRLLLLSREEEDFHSLPIVLPCQENFAQELIWRVGHSICGEGLHCFFLVKRNDLPISLCLFDGRRPMFHEQWILPELVKEEPEQTPRGRTQTRSRIIFHRMRGWKIDETYGGSLEPLLA